MDSPLRNSFIHFFNNELAFDEDFHSMGGTSEDSPWHREKTVLVHTYMVVMQYIAIAPDDWSYQDLLGAFAVAFHDFGKPAAEEEKTKKDDEGKDITYRTYKGHEKISARMWESYAVENFKLIHQYFSDFQADDIVAVGWIIEHHLPFGMKKLEKLRNLKQSMIHYASAPVFYNCIKADCWGRNSDQHLQKKLAVTQFVEEMEAVETPTIEMLCENPSLYVLIGASGCGKSTYKDDLLISYEDKHTGIHNYSWDDLRLEWYAEGQGIDQYKLAFDRSCDDGDFNSKIMQEFFNLVKTGESIIVDNTNTSVKSRRPFVSHARQHGYNIVAIVFPTTLDILYKRMDTRPDKRVPFEAVRRQYNSTTYPNYGEFDEVRVVQTF